LLPSDIQGKIILFTALNWGLGHASRSIPLIRQLARHRNEVHIASDGLSLTLLKLELPSFEIHSLPSLHIHYKRDSMALNMLSQLPHLVNHYRKDSKAISALQEFIKADIIISDHRYAGLHKSCYNIFLGHQLSILNPDFSYHQLASKTNASLINRFDEIWVPDSDRQILSGKLSSSRFIHKPIHFIGPLSRFEKMSVKDKTYDMLAVLSGPEPKRTTLENRIINLMMNIDFKCAIATGTNRVVERKQTNIDFFNVQTTSELQSLFNQSQRFIGRAGYSTIMDLAVLKLPSMLIPTPGQTEQMYLAKHLDNKQFQFCDEEKLCIESFQSK